MNKSSSIFISDKNSLSGIAIYNNLKKQGYKKIFTPNSKIDLSNYEHVSKFFRKNKPEYIVICSNKSGGIEANLKFPAELMDYNLVSQYNIIKVSHQYNVKKLMFIASSCVYPKNIKRPSKESDFLSGKVEDSNQSYSIAKISGIEMCRAYRLQHKVNFFSVIPTNIYGPGESYEKKYLHVIPALIKKIHSAKEKNKNCLKLLGDGKPVREFLYSDDFANACIKILKNKKKFDLINIGSGKSLNIENLANKIKSIIGYNGKIYFSSKKLNGTNVKKLNFKKLRDTGWKPSVNLNLGLRETYFDYLNQIRYK